MNRPKVIIVGSGIAALCRQAMQEEHLDWNALGNYESGAGPGNGGHSFEIRKTTELT